MLRQNSFLTRLFYLSLLILSSILLFQTCSSDEPTSTEPTLSESEFEYGNPTVYTVDSAPNSVVHDSATGVTLSFPEGGSGDVAISKILSAPSASIEGKGVKIEYAGDTPINLVVDTSDGTLAEVLEYGNFVGCFDDEIGGGKRWAAVPRDDTDGSKISFMLMMPYDLAKSSSVKPIGSNNFWIARLKPDADLVEQRVATELQILTFYNQLIKTLPATIKNAVDTKGQSKFVSVKYDGGAYYAGFWMKVLGKGVSYEPTLHLSLPPRIQQIAHELGHYFVHLLVGDKVQVTLENQANLTGGHAVLDVVGRDVLLEDLAYYTEFVLTGLGADAYDLFEPDNMLKGSHPLKVDFPSYEGFAAHLLAQLIRTDPTIRDFESGQRRNIPLAKLNYGQVFEIISKGATGINTLRKNIEDYLGPQANKLPVICHRLGWRYLAEGKLVDAKGDPIANASIEPIVIIDGVVYKGMEGTATSSTDGTFVLSGEAFPGKSILRIKTSSIDSTDVPIFIDWNTPTTETIKLGDIVVNKKKLSIEADQLIGKVGKEIKFTAISEGAAPKGNAKYVWSFGDYTGNVTVLNDSIVTHTYADTGTYKVSVELFENSTGNKITEAILSFSVKGIIPTITSITPSSASVGEVVQIKGNNFGNNSSSGEVWFGAVKALASDIVSWINTQIDVKVPEGAVTGDVHVVDDGEKSNDVSFTVGGAPIITEIIDHLYNRDYNGIHRFSLPNNTAEIIGQNFGDYPPIRKVYVNNIEAQVYNWSDTLVQFQLPLQPTGNISVKLVTSTGTSNEFPYFSGYPLSYLTTTNSLNYNLKIIVDYNHIGIGGEGRIDWYIVGCMSDPTYSGEIANKDAFSWSNNTLIIDISKQEPTLSGTLKFTFSLDGLNIEKLELDYINSEKGLEEVHFIGENIPYRTYNNDYATQDLLGVTTSLSGQISSFLDGEEVGRTDITGINTSAGYSQIYLGLSF